ncbi:MAG: hypothetical protein ACOX2R_00355 [Anaerolineae bacterium]|jgi:hypothetical protein
MSVRSLIASIQNFVARQRYLALRAGMDRAPLAPSQCKRLRRAYQFWSRLSDILGCPPF